MRRAANIDANQPEIITALANAGCTTQSLAGVGCGCPDVLVGFRGINVLLEIKNPDRKGGQKRNTMEAQAKFRKYWTGHVAVVKSAQEALDAVADAYIKAGGAA